MESSSKKSSPLCNQQQASQSGEGLVNRGKNQTWQSSSRKSSPPPRKEFLAALQKTGIPRRPPVRNFSPPPKQPEYLAAPLLKIPRRPPNNRNTSPPFCWKFFAAPETTGIPRRRPLLRKKGGKPRWLTLGILEWPFVWEKLTDGSQVPPIVTSGQFAISQE